MRRLDYSNLYSLDYSQLGSYSRHWLFLLVQLRGVPRAFPRPSKFTREKPWERGYYSWRSRKRNAVSPITPRAPRAIKEQRLETSQLVSHLELLHRQPPKTTCHARILYKACIKTPAKQALTSFSSNFRLKKMSSHQNKT